jgi:hypothetical protein
MITEILYKCEVCGAVYGKEEDAQKCERSHISAHSVFYEGFPQKEKYPGILIMEMGNGHRMQYRIEKAVVDVPSGEPYVNSITVSHDPIYARVLFLANGYNLPEEMYTWNILFDGEPQIATSDEPKLILSTSLSELYDNSSTVEVTVSAPSIATTHHILKEVG